jgi:hypothetical protein
VEGALGPTDVCAAGEGVVVVATGVDGGGAAPGVAAGHASWTCNSAVGDSVGMGVGGAVITPAGGPEAGVGVEVGLAEGEAGVPRVAPGTYHCRLPNCTGKARRSSASGTSLVVKASGLGGGLLPGLGKAQPPSLAWVDSR